MCVCVGCVRVSLPLHLPLHLSLFFLHHQSSYTHQHNSSASWSKEPRTIFPILDFGERRLERATRGIPAARILKPLQTKIKCEERQRYTDRPPSHCQNNHSRMDATKRAGKGDRRRERHFGLRPGDAMRSTFIREKRALSGRRAQTQPARRPPRTQPPSPVDDAAYARSLPHAGRPCARGRAMAARPHRMRHPRHGLLEGRGHADGWDARP